MKDTNYAFGVARIRALENKLLSGQEIADLLNKKDYFSAIEYLSSKGYSTEKNDIDSIIRSEADVLSRTLRECVPDLSVLNSLYILNDYFNIKALVKCMLTSENPLEHFVYPTTIKFDAKNILYPQVVFRNLNEKYRKTACEAYDYSLKSKNGRYCEMMIDKAAISELVCIYKNSKSRLCKEVSALLADTANIKTAFRCIATGQSADFISGAIGECCIIKKDKLVLSAIEGYDELISYLNTTEYAECADVYKSKPSDFEKWCDDKIISIARRSVYTSFGFDPVASYFYRKNLEIKTVRMILTAIKSDVNRQLVKERVRSIYA